MEFEQILQLIDRVSAAGLQSFAYDSEGLKLHMEGRKAEQVIMAEDAGESGYKPVQTSTQGVNGTQTPDRGILQESNPETEVVQGTIVKSPLVGTFYAAPSEEGEPFVKIGTRVKKGQILAIVEAMKLMNEIESEADGEIAEIYVENAVPVEYGQPLFRVV